VPPYLLYCALTRRAVPLLLLLGHHAWRRVFVAQPWPWMRSLFCLDKARYWRTQRLVLDDAGFDEVPAEGVLLAFSPHGMLCCGWTLSNASSHFRNVRWLIADNLLLLPFISDFLRWHASDSVGAASLKRVLASGKSCALLPGGFEEATCARYGQHRVFIRRRRGFIKYALQHGYRVHPVYTFGEGVALRWALVACAKQLAELCYRTFTPFETLRMRLCAWKVPAVLFWGAALMPFMPRRDVDLATVVGPPLCLPRIEQPTAEQVAHWHDAYCAALQGLFEKHKGQYAAAGLAATLTLL